MHHHAHPPTGASCSHDGFHSGGSRLSRELGRLRYVIVCDDCLAELREVAAVDYRPRFEAAGRASG
jgi:hypothetical protein